MSEPHKTERPSFLVASGKGDTGLGRWPSCVDRHSLTPAGTHLCMPQRGRLGSTAQASLRPGKLEDRWLPPVSVPLVLSGPASPRPPDCQEIPPTMAPAPTVTCLPRSPRVSQNRYVPGPDRKINLCVLKELIRTLSYLSVVGDAVLVVTAGVTPSPHQMVTFSSLGASRCCLISRDPLVTLGQHVGQTGIGLNEFCHSAM